jgi:general secretion pathway protein L
MTLNLLPHGRRAGRRWVGPWVSRVALVAVGFLGIALLASGAINERRSLWLIAERLKANEPEIAAIEKLVRGMNEHERDLKILQGIGTQSVKMLDLLAELASVMPSDAWITHLDYLEQEKKGWSRGDLSLSGLAVSSSGLIALLEDSPLLEQVEFVGPITKREGKEGYKVKAVVVKPGQATPTAEQTRLP